ncbi:type VI secretion system contractile sheath small subunit [Neptunomonas phycophila]|uniref:type VI secretion system contractile sheath small subunit n=1 Tax=Neptunomonas phycophila TaxID=1572645 RepID=UPI0026E1751B|nr:type VI secretion system contractile sheath small subunit [Neptunomonas phycophila]MDO6782826.1 type VI secretion system contractile sheath small subunit [Neptunomonas phycophila]
MGTESIHKKLERVRKPRVHITYDVETEGAVVHKELPFVMGIMGDFTGNNPANALKSLKDRKFIQIESDNLNEVMAKMAPGLRYKVDNTLHDGNSSMSVDLEFKSMEDFEPGRVVEQIEPLKNLMETRNKLRDLLTKADRSEELETLLEKVLQSTDDMQSLSKELKAGETE